jgi:hypothetical protein
MQMHCETDMNLGNQGAECYDFGHGQSLSFNGSFAVILISSMEMWHVEHIKDVP